MLLPRGVHAVHSHFVSESSERSTVFANEIAEQVLRDYLGYDPKRKNGRYAEITNISAASLDAWVTIMERGLA